MASKTKFSGQPFKLQVYVKPDTVSKIDKICEEEGIYRSGLVTKAINKLLKTPRYRKILGEEEAG